MRYTYSIIETEKSTIDSLQNCFENHPDYLCVGVTGCYEKAMDTILEFDPTVVFINVDGNKQDCPDMAFDFVNDLYKYVEKLPNFIAMSSTTEHAYTSIKNNFFDYILKPLNSFELRKSIARLRKKPIEVPNKLCLKSYKDYRFIDMEEILFLKADNSSTDFFMLDGSVVSAYKTLKHFETSLPDNFTRIHNSYVVNQNYISRIHYGKSKCTIKKNHLVPFSKSYRDIVETLEKSISKRAILSLN